MNDRLRPSLLSFLWLLWFVSFAVQAGLTARLDRNQVAEGETLQLLVEADGQVSGSPDTEPLRNDFDILGVASGSQVNIVNGRMDARTTWTITLAPKRSGKLVIPTLELNGERSAPLTLQVSEVPVAAGAAGGQPVFIETEVDRHDPYVQGMVRYTIRLFLRVKLNEGRLSEPQPDNALLRRLGDDREYSVEREGRRYRVIERRYAIFPQASGELRLPPPVLDGRIPEKSSRRNNRLQDFFGRDPFDDPFFGRTPLADAFTSSRPLRVRGKAQVLNVRPRPDQAGSHPWLPAKSVELHENWQPQGGEVRVGEPLTRTVTIRAHGVSGEQLPDLEPGAAEGFKVYPDRAVASTRDLEHSVEGEKSRNMAFVPIRPGRFTLPALRLHWWDSVDDRERVAELPERLIEVLPAVAAQGAAQLEADTKAPFSTLETGEATDQIGTGQLVTNAVTRRPDSGVWPWVSLALALLWLLTLGVWWRGRRGTSFSLAETDAHDTTGLDVGKARKNFLLACRANDPDGARRHLLAWATGHWRDDPPAGLDDISRRLADSGVRQALADLDLTLYGAQKKAWDGSMLAVSLTRLPPRKGEKHDRLPLPDLYT